MSASCRGCINRKSLLTLAIENVATALRNGAILVVIILFLFLMNVRTTLITLTAIPLSIVTTALVFAGFGLSVNTMTLGGLAVAIGELVDDAIVDVENIFRRLRENRLRAEPASPLLVVFQASVEIRNSIVYGTIIVMLGVRAAVRPLGYGRTTVHAARDFLHRLDCIFVAGVADHHAGTKLLATA